MLSLYSTTLLALNIVCATGPVLSLPLWHRIWFNNTGAECTGALSFFLFDENSWVMHSTTFWSQRKKPQTVDESSSTLYPLCKLHLLKPWTKFNLKLGCISVSSSPRQRIFYLTRMIWSLDVIERRREEKSLGPLLSSTLDSSALQGIIFKTSQSPKTHLLPQCLGLPVTLNTKCVILSLGPQVHKRKRLQH